MNDTPRTNAMLEANSLRCACADKPIELCCELERELSELRREVAGFCKALGEPTTILAMVRLQEMIKKAKL